jgi:hypothetical protein
MESKMITYSEVVGLIFLSASSVSPQTDGRKISALPPWGMRHQLPILEAYEDYSKCFITIGRDVVLRRY